MDDDHIPVSPPSFKSKLKTSLCLSCCFRRGRRPDHRQVLDSPPGEPQTQPSDDRPTLLWHKTRTPHDLKDDIKDKCMTIFGRGGSGSMGKHKRQYSSADFSYDPLSYSLNFEDGFDDEDEYPLRNFSARLPPPPPSQPVKPMSSVREIAAI